MSRKQTYYSKDLENPERYPKISKWVVGEEGSTGYSCRICNSNTLKLGNMGVEALKNIKEVTVTKRKLKNMLKKA